MYNWEPVNPNDLMEFPIPAPSLLAQERGKNLAGERGLSRESLTISPDHLELSTMQVHPHVLLWGFLFDLA